MGSKRRVRRDRQKGKAEPDFIQGLNETVQAALGVMTSEDAEGLIGEKPDVLEVLLAGVQASVGLLWSTALAAGARKKQKTLKMVAASQVVLLTLVLYAFAKGVEHGSQDRDGLGGDGA